MVQANVGHILGIGFLWAMELPCAIFDIVEYTNDGTFAAHYRLGCKNPCVRRINKLPIVKAAGWIVCRPKVDFDNGVQGVLK